MDCVLQLHTRAVANVNCTDEFGNTALHLAAQRSRKSVVVCLLQAGIDATLRNSQGIVMSFMPKCSYLFIFRTFFINRWYICISLIILFFIFVNLNLIA